MLLSPDDQVIWVTARESDALLGFSATKLRTAPGHALIAKVMVGEFPLGEALIDHGTRIIIADSNANGVKGAPYNIAVVSTADALSGKPALLGYVPTGPGAAPVRGSARRRHRTGHNRNAHAVEAINVGDLP